MGARVSKFTISLPEDLLSEIDAEAETSGQSRSAIIREASALYLRDRREADAAAVRRRRALEAVRLMREFPQGRPVSDDRPSLEILREIRSHDGLGDPPRASTGGDR